MNAHQSITALPPSPDEERRSRMIKYTVMMSVRVGCVFAMLFVQGWWILLFALGAIFLPYFAVVVANVKGGKSKAVLRPGTVVHVERDAGSPGARRDGDTGAGEPEEDGR